MDVDHCLGVEVTEPEDGNDPIFNSSGCMAKAKGPRFNQYLNLNAPFQLGGWPMNSPMLGRMGGGMCLMAGVSQESHGTQVDFFSCDSGAA